MRIAPKGHLMPTSGFSRIRRPLPPAALSGAWWRNHRDVRVCSIMTTAIDQVDGATVTCWLLDVTTAFAWPSMADVRSVVEGFAIDRFDFENYHPGGDRVARLILPADPARRARCSTGADDRFVVDRDGFVWSTPVGDADCTGCHRFATETADGIEHPRRCGLHDREAPAIDVS